MTLLFLAEVEMIQRRQATTQDLDESAVAGDDMIATISQKLL